MLDLEVIPERSIGCDAWEFVLGMPFSQAVAIIQSQVGTIRGVEVLYNAKNPLASDLVLLMPQDGIRLIFDPVAQRLKIIEINNMKLVTLRYSGVLFNSPDITPTIEQIEHYFGATHPGLYDDANKLFALSFRGISFVCPVTSKFEPAYAHGLGKLQFANGQSPVVSRTTIYYGSQHQLHTVGGIASSPLPELPLSCYRHQHHLRSCEVLRTASSTTGLRLRMYTEVNRSAERLCRVVMFGWSCVDVYSALGTPSKIYYKCDDKMRIHRPTPRRRPLLVTDFFFNYCTLGLDILFDAHTHRVKKFVLHTNYPGHYNFNMYHRCEFHLSIQPTRTSNHNLIDCVNSVTITAYSNWENICRALGVHRLPVILNRNSSTNTVNPFGSTFCYGYQDIIFEVMPNNFIASITLYQTEETDRNYAINAIA